jgi:hypothetical protein
MLVFDAGRSRHRKGTTSIIGAVVDAVADHDKVPR